MAIVESVIIFIVALVILAKASSFAVKHAVRFAKLSGIHQLAVGFLLLAVSTSFPELIITLISTAEGEGLIGFSTAVGSSIGDFTIMMGIAAIGGFTVARKYRDDIDSAIMIGAVLAFIILVLNIIGYAFGIFAIMIFLIYMRIIIRKGVPIKNNHVKGLKITAALKSALLTVAATAIVAVSAYFLVNSVVDISLTAGISKALLGATVIAMGSFLPELTLTISAMRKKNIDLALGDAAGSVVTNIALVGGIAAFGGIMLDTITSVELGFLILASMFIYTLIKKGRLGKKEAFMLFGLYVVYLLVIIFLAIY